MKKNVTYEKAYAFAIRIVKAHQFLYQDLYDLQNFQDLFI
jgi:hypothetical protein